MTAWRTTEILGAEDFLTRSVAEAEKAMRVAAEVRGREPSADDVRRVMQYAKSSDASPALRSLQDRIARGGLSWRQVLTGEASQDPMVRKALEDDRERLAELIHGEAPAPRPPAPRRRRDDDPPQSFSEDAW